MGDELGISRQRVQQYTTKLGVPLPRRNDKAIRKQCPICQRIFYHHECDRRVTCSKECWHKLCYPLVTCNTCGKQLESQDQLSHIEPNIQKNGLKITIIVRGNACVNF